MKFIEKIALLTFFSAAFAVNVNAQERKITGNVVDSDGIPLAGANVIEYNTTNGTITDFDGNFTITLSSYLVITSRKS